MAALPYRPELVIFDVDGTLLDPSSWWGKAYRGGLQAFTAKTGIKTHVPTDREAVSVVGFSGIDLWGPFLPEDARDRYLEVRDCTVPLEVAILHEGVDHIYPGVREFLGSLRQACLHLALASNCHDRYFQAVLHGQGLGEYVDAPYCLSSPGVTSKTDMLRLAMERFGTSKAVMVGDRSPDWEAAAAHNLPFIWRTNDYTTPPATAIHWDGSPAKLLQLLGV